MGSGLHSKGVMMTDQHPKILIVDDVDSNRFALQEALEGVAADIHTASSGQEALEMMITNSYVVVLLDVQMPEMDGFEMAELVRSNKKTASTPIIFVTAVRKDRQHIFKGYELGAIDYLFKPVDPNILKSKVEIFVEMYDQKRDKLSQSDDGKTHGINRLILHDALTGLANRSKFEDELTQLVDLSQNHDDYQFALINLDIDNFKIINKTYGSSVADKVLKQVSLILRGLVRKQDGLFRLDGDEFSILLTQLQDFSDAGHVANKIKLHMEQPIQIDEHKVYVTFSVGIACFPLAGTDSKTLMRNVDIAMFRAKSLGKNQICYFTEELQDEYTQRVQLEIALQSALKNNEFSLVYQPIYDLVSKSPVGIEVLIRWDHPEFGEILPDDFIPIAEKSRIIEKIGEWVMLTACKQIQHWVDQGYDQCFFAINLSPTEMQRTNLFSIISGILSQFSFKKELLFIEVTESSIMDYKVSADILLSRLADVNVRVILDDFGTGYTSLMKLRNLPVYALKIDVSFISNLGKHRNDEMITNAILSISKNLSYIPIAEGIENQYQLDYLIKHDCRYGQGFYLKHPQRVDEMTEFLEKLHATKKKD